MLIVGPELFYGLNVGHWEKAVFEAVFALDEMLIPEGEFML